MHNKYLKFFAATIVFFTCMVLPNSAHAILLTFEDISGMSSASIPVPVSSQLHDQYLSAYGVQFSSSSGTPYAAVVYLGEGHAVSGKNALGGATSGGILTYSNDGNIIATFFNPIDPNVPAVTDFFGLTTDRWGDGKQVYLNAYNLNGDLIDQFITNDAGTTNLFINRSTADIHKVQFFGSGTAAVDNFTFNPVNPVKPVVPEPTSLALLGLGLSGLLFKRKRIA